MKNDIFWGIMLAFAICILSVLCVFAIQAGLEECKKNTSYHEDCLSLQKNYYMNYND